MNKKEMLWVVASSVWRETGVQKQNFWTNTFQMLQLLDFCCMREHPSMLVFGLIQQRLDAVLPKAGWGRRSYCQKFLQQLHLVLIKSVQPGN